MAYSEYAGGRRQSLWMDRPDAGEARPNLCRPESLADTETRRRDSLTDAWRNRRDSCDRRRSRDRHSISLDRNCLSRSHDHFVNGSPENDEGSRAVPEDNGGQTALLDDVEGCGSVLDDEGRTSTDSDTFAEIVSGIPGIDASLQGDRHINIDAHVTVASWKIDHHGVPCGKKDLKSLPPVPKLQRIPQPGRMPGLIPQRPGLLSGAVNLQRLMDADFFDIPDLPLEVPWSIREGDEPANDENLNAEWLSVLSTDLQAVSEHI